MGGPDKKFFLAGVFNSVGTEEVRGSRGVKREKNRMVHSEKMMVQRLTVAARKLDGVVEHPYTTVTGPLFGAAQFG